jgi:hypothetical protein
VIRAVAAAAAVETTCADHLAGYRIARESDADDESLGVLMFPGIDFAAVGRVEEESPAPQTRLVCNHLQASSAKTIGRKKRVTVLR